MNLAEQQSKPIAGHLTGHYELPSHPRTNEIIGGDESKHLGQYYNAPRHTIQVDFARYVKDLRKEIAAGKKRASGRATAR